MGDKYERIDMPELRSLHTRLVILMAVILLATLIAWPSFKSPAIPFVVVVVTAAIALKGIRAHQFMKCRKCRSSLTSNPFQPKEPIVFKCDNCKIIWLTGWNHGASDNCP